MLCGSPFNHKVSRSNSGAVAAEVNVLRSSCDKVTDMDELVGRFNFVSLFPQYLRVAMLTGAVTDAV